MTNCFLSSNIPYYKIEEEENKKDEIQNLENLEFVKLKSFCADDVDCQAYSFLMNLLESKKLMVENVKVNLNTKEFNEYDKDSNLYDK